MTKLTKDGQPQCALDLFNTYVDSAFQHGFKIQRDICHSAMIALCTLGRTEEAFVLLDNMATQKHLSAPSQISFNIIVSHVSKSKMSSLNYLLDLIQSMTLNGFIPSPPTFSSIIHSLHLSSPSNPEALKEAIRTMEIMVNQYGLLPDQVVIQTVMSHAKSLQDSIKTLEKIHSLIKTKVTIDAVTLNRVLKHFNDLSSVTAFFQDLKTRLMMNFLVDSYTLDIMILLCHDIEQLEYVMELASEFEIPMTSFIFEYTVRKHVDKGLYELAENLFKQSLKYGFTPTTDMLNKLIMCYLKQERWEDAKRVFKEDFKVHGRPYSKDSFTHFFQYFAACGMFEEALEFFHRMLEHDVDFDEYTSSSLICKYAAAGLIEDCFVIVKLSLSRKVIPSLNCLEILMNVIAECGKFEQLEELSQLIITNCIPIQAKTVNILLKGLNRLGSEESHVSAVLETINDMNISITSYMHQEMIVSAGKNGSFEQCVELVSVIEKKFVEVSSHVLEALFSVCKTRKHLECTLEQYRMRKITLSDFAYNLLFRTCLRLGLHEFGKEVYDNVVKSGVQLHEKVMPNVISILIATGEKTTAMNILRMLSLNDSRVLRRCFVRFIAGQITSKTSCADIRELSMSLQDCKINKSDIPLLELEAALSVIRFDLTDIMRSNFSPSKWKRLLIALHPYMFEAASTEQEVSSYCNYFLNNDIIVSEELVQRALARVQK